MAVPSLSKLKTREGITREQLVTLKSLQSRMLLATQNMKVPFEIKMKGKQFQWQSSV